MAEVLLIPPSEIAAQTIMGANVDLDKWVFCIADVQNIMLQRLLGTLLFDKMVTDWTDPPTYAGLYNTLYVDYIKPILKYQATATYIEIASYTLANGGLFKNQPANSEVVDKEEAQFLAQKYSANAQEYILRFDKFIINNPIAEYKTWQDEVNASKTVKVTGGWWFPNNNSDE